MWNPLKEKPPQRAAAINRMVDGAYDKTDAKPEAVRKNITATHHMVREDGTQVVEIEIGTRTNKQDQPRLLGSFIVGSKHHLHIYVLGEVVELTGIALPQASRPVTRPDSPTSGGVPEPPSKPEVASVEVPEPKPPPQKKPPNVQATEEGFFTDTGVIERTYEGQSKPSKISVLWFKTAKGEIIEKVGVQLMRKAEELKLRPGDHIRVATLEPTYRGRRRTNNYTIEVLKRAQ